jgi:hypothetical protein
MTQAIAEDLVGVSLADPPPHPWLQRSFQEAVIGAITSVFPNPDDPNEPLGPGAPHIRELVAAVAVLQMSTLIADAPARQAIQSTASSLIASKAAQLTTH